MTNSENPQSLPSSLPATTQSGASPSSDLSLPPAASQAQSEEERALAAFASSQPSFVTSLPMMTSEDFQRVSSLMAVSDAKSKNCANTTIGVVGFAVDFGAVGATEDGEVIEGLRVHILTDDGRSIFSTSRGIIKAMRDGLQIFKRGLWEPSAILEIREVKGKRGDALIGIWRGRKAAAKAAKKA